MYDRNSVRLSLVHALPLAAKANAVSVASLLSLAGLEADAFRDRDQVVRRSQVVTMMNGLARKSGDATIGFKMAEMTNPGRLGPFGRSLVLGRTLREALELQRRHMPWLQRGVSINLQACEKTVQWTHRMQGCDPAEARLLTEGIAAFFVGFLRAATGDESAGLHVILPHKPAGRVSTYEDALRCAVSFEKGADLVVRFDTTLLDRRNALRPADERGLSPEPYASVPVSVALADEQFLASLQRMVEVAALWGKLTVEDAARTFGISPRSLQRRLARLDTSFERIVDVWRRRQAEELLTDPAIGISDVAFRLGYSHPSHFIRAFRRWHGVPPTDFRRSWREMAIETGPRSR
jgi:AraC-like DNA-binding protein